MHSDAWTVPESLVALAHHSLTGGRTVVGFAALVVVGLAGLLAVARRGLDALARTALTASVATVAVEALVWLSYRPLPLQLRPAEIAWIWLGLLGLVHGTAALRDRPRPVGVALALAATAAVVVGSAGRVNAEVGTFPTPAALVAYEPVVSMPMPFDRLPGFEPGPQSGSPVEAAWTEPLRHPKAGVITEAPIPGTVSGFAARPAELYLPPAYLTTPRPLLPVLVLVAGQPGDPADWLASGRLTETMNAFAADHHGLAPVVVIPDALGTHDANPLCLDSRLGASATYLVRDVPSWIEQHLQVATDHDHWAVGGFSFGGTCALQLAVDAPDVYPTFLDVSGQDEPSVGDDGSRDHARTVRAAFGGDEAAFARVDPRAMLASTRPRPVAGVFVVGAQDDRFRPQQQRMYEAAAAAGVDARYYELPGGHGGEVWATALALETNWLARRMDLIA